jgi:hypothetical protein
VAGAATAGAQPHPIIVEDMRIVEDTTGSATCPGSFKTVLLPVRLVGGGASSPVTVSYTVLPGSALSPSDYNAPGPSLITFNFLEDLKTIPLQIVCDAVNEWSPTLLQDEAFMVQLSNPSANAFIQKSRGTVTLIDDDRSMAGVQFLTAVSGGNISIGATKLQWRIPGSQPSVSDVFVAWKIGAGCTFPASTTDIVPGGGMAVGSASPAGAVQTWTHPSPPPNTEFCYSVFAMNPGPVSGTEIAKVRTRTFDATGTIAWTYASGSGTGSVVPPTVGQDAIYTTDNLGILHAMTRGTTGGLWPSLWNPVALGKPTQNRSAVVPGLGGGWRLLLGTDGGGVHAVDARFGNVIWSRSSAFGTALPSSGGVQAQPAALLKQFGGNNDMVLVGTNFTTPNNRFFALDM